MPRVGTLRVFHRWGINMPLSGSAFLMSQVPNVVKALRQIQSLCACTAVLLICAWPLRGQEPQEGFRQFQIDAGASLYAANCAECHGGGEGIPGVNLRTGQFRHAVTDEDLMAVIQNGVPGTAMPPHNLVGSDLAALVAFIRSMKDDQTTPVKLGNPEKGKALFDGAGGCLDCHRVGAQGSRKALNLSDAGSNHPPSYLQKALLDPNAIAAATPESRMMRAVTNKGTVITGRRLNEDTYTLQMLDDDENLVSLEKENLRSLTVLTESPM